MATEISDTLLDLMTAWFVILRRFAATYVRAKHIRAETVNSNTHETCSVKVAATFGMLDNVMLTPTRACKLKYLSLKDDRAALTYPIPDWG